MHTPTRCDHEPPWTTDAPKPDESPLQEPPKLCHCEPTDDDIMHPMKTFVYVAGPYTKPDPDTNIRIAVLAADELRRMGFIPFVPHLTHYWHLVTPDDYEAWLAYDFQWITRCDALLRLPGDSPGADREIGFATAHEIPVFYSTDELVEWAGVPCPT